MTDDLLRDTREPVPHGLRWLILARLMAITLCAASFLLAALAQPGVSLGFFGSPAVYILLFGLGALNIAYLLILPRVRRGLTGFMLLQFVVDMGAVTGLVFFTGGVHSNFVNLYFVLIMTASLMMRRRRSGLFASLATVGLAVVTALYLSGHGMQLVSAIYHLKAEGDVRRAVGGMLWTVVAFFAVAYLSGLLSERLEHARTLNEEILQNMAEGLAVFDSRGRIAFLNQEFERLFAMGRPLQFGDTLQDVFSHPDDQTLRQIIAGRKDARFELPEREDGLHPRPLTEVRISTLGDPKDARGMVMLATDLSLRQRAEIAERRAERFGAVSEMAAGLAHEIRNPLASVRGSIQEISRDFEPGSSDKRLADIVIRESDRLDEIITNFLQYARQRPLRATNCRISELLSEVKTLLENRPDAAGVEIELRLGEESWVRCDSDQLREVFLNFGVNAINAMRGEGRLTITYPDREARPTDTVVMRRDDDLGVVVSFRDTGPGLAAGTEHKVFEPFYTTRSRGSGLGLAIAQRVVESHDGCTWVKSDPDQGAEFCCWLPRGGPFSPGAPEMRETTADDAPAL